MALPFQTPEMLQAMLTDPRSTPQQRAAAVAALQGSQGGGGAPMSEMESETPDGDPRAWLSAGAAAAEPAAAQPDLSGGTGDLAGWRGDFMEMIKRQVAADTGEPEYTDEDKGLALARFGFGMAASNSPSLAGAIGQGGAYGLEGLDRMRQQRAQERLKRDLGMQSGMLRAEQIEQQREQAKQASQDRQAATDQRRDAAALSHEDRQARIAAERLAAADRAAAGADRQAALDEQRYTANASQRLKDYYTTGIWRELPGDSERGVTGAPTEGTEYEGPLVTSPKLSLKQKQKLEGEKPQAERSLKIGLKNMGDMNADAEALATHPGISGAVGLRAGQEFIPGTDAANFKANLKTMKTKNFTAVLQAMRDASKTGGALGSVTEREIDKMESLIAALDQSQDEDQFKTNLQKVNAYAQEMGAIMRDGYVKTYGDKDVPSLPWEKKNSGAGGKAPEAATETVIEYERDPATGKLRPKK